MSSTRWLQRQLNDPYVRRAQAEGYRSRAAYKLIELDEKFGLLKKARAVVYLGITPGGSSQVVRKANPRARVAGIDLLPCEPIEGVEIRVADNGEILVKSPGLLKEYYKNPAATAEVLTADGWYHTGDAGFLDAGGHLKIIDRAKDVGRLMGGANDGAMFAPKYVENKLKFFPHIKEAVAFGDKREKVCAFINIDFEAVGNWAEKRNLPYAGYTDLAQKPEVYQLIKECVEKVNADLSIDELLAGSQVSRFLVLHKELDADDGELTRTRKVRRGYIGDKYQVLVDALYGGRTEQFIETAVKFEDGRAGSVSATLKILDSKTFDTMRRAA